MTNTVGARGTADRAPSTGLRQATRDNFEYLVATLSRRTTGKKYENYVINAIWNALDDETLRPVTQQYVNRRVQHSGLALVDLRQEPAAEDAHRAYIDLYFPALRLGIECDEAQHFAGGRLVSEPGPRRDDADRRTDIQRAIPGYSELRVSVVVDDDGDAVSPGAVLDQIDEVVAAVRRRKQEVEQGVHQWAARGPVVWQTDEPDWQLARRAGVLRAGDGLVFATNGEVRELFGMGDGTGTRSSSFRSNFELTESSDVVWCPALARKTKDGAFRSTNSAGWLNWIAVEGDDVLIGQAPPSGASIERRAAAIADGERPLPPWDYALPADKAAERADSSDREPAAWTPGGDRWDGARRITFVRTQDAVGRRGFQFLGVFSPPVGHREIDGVSFEVCRLVSDSVELP